MTPEKTDALKRDFPKTLGSLDWGFECGDGWEPTIRSLCEKLEPLGAVATQVKEKFGGLRFYAISITEEAQELIDAAEEATWDVCEECGEAGKPRPDLGWIQTLCDKHYDEARQP